MISGSLDMFIDLLSEEQKQDIATKVYEKMLTAVEKIDVKEITEKLQEALLDTDFYFDCLNVEDITDKMSKIIIKGLDTLLANK